MNEQTKKTLARLKEKGYTHLCMNCYKGMKGAPSRLTSDPKDHECPECGCDLFVTLEEFAGE